MNWKALNHTPVSTTAIYARLQLDPVGEALEANAQRSLALGREFRSSAERS